MMPHLPPYCIMEQSKHPADCTPLTDYTKPIIFLHTYNVHVINHLSLPQPYTTLPSTCSPSTSLQAGLVMVIPSTLYTDITYSTVPHTPTLAASLTVLNLGSRYTSKHTYTTLHLFRYSNSHNNQRVPHPDPHKSTDTKSYT